MINTDIIKINAKINILKEEYTNLQNEVNYFYWPTDAKLRKKKKDYTWYFLISLCLLGIAILSVVCNIVRNEYLIGIVIGLSVVLVGFTFFITYRVLKKLEVLKKEWDKALEPVESKKSELDKTMDEAKKMMIRVLENDQKVLDEIGDSYEEVYEYYDKVVNS